MWSRAPQRLQAPSPARALMRPGPFQTQRGVEDDPAELGAVRRDAEVRVHPCLRRPGRPGGQGVNSSIARRRATRSTAAIDYDSGRGPTNCALLDITAKPREPAASSSMSSGAPPRPVSFDMLTIGGGVRTLADMRALLQSAPTVSLNTAAGAPARLRQRRRTEN